MAKQQEQLRALVSTLAKSNNGGSTTPKDYEKCPKCHCKKHPRGVTECWANPKNKDKHPQQTWTDWNAEPRRMLERKTIDARWSQ